MRLIQQAKLYSSFSFFLPAAIILALLSACSSSPSVENKPTAQQNEAASSKPSELITPLSPYSTDGLKALSLLRQNNTALNNFLEKNRKPDYFFSTANDKVYCIYLSSNNLYTFKPQQASGGPTRFHPLPAPIKQSLKNVSRQQQTESQVRASTVEIPFSLQSKRSIEASLKQAKPSPYLSTAVINGILQGRHDAQHKLYYFDHSLESSIENQYSAKYETRKQAMKLIYPQAYDSSNIYGDTDFKAKKIFIKKDLNRGMETALIVPDFFPGSEFYRGSYTNIVPAFASLYQVKIPPTHAELKDLRWRYILRPCQKDSAQRCTYTEGNVTQIRAIVIAAMLYNKRTGRVIETITLK